MPTVVDEILDAFKQRGAGRYGEEGVTQIEHALQSAQLAVRANSEDRLVAAALLHDIGHILGQEQLPDDCRENLDDKHESKGYQFLLDHFGSAVADPVRLHVVAKRYLCTKNPNYVAKLSPTSLKSYHDQGGAMSPEEMQQFEAEPCHKEALRLRHWDDAAKDPAAITPTLDEFVPYIEASLL